MTTYDAAVIGYGPTGATLANLLAKQGLSVLVIEREARMYALPRAVHFDDETMRVFQTVEIADQLLPLTMINPGMKFVDKNNEVILDWPRSRKITNQGWNASYRFHQPDLERLLRRKLSSYDTVCVQKNTSLISIVQQQSHVIIRVQRENEPTAISYRALFVIGCDGANSITKDIMGWQQHDYGFEERWLVIDLILKRPRPDLGDHSIQFCWPNRPMTYCRGPGLRRRWEINLLKSEDEKKVIKPDHIWSLLRPWITPNAAKLERCAVYTFKSQVAEQWRDGRVMIAGDSAHLTPPFLGQGMCIGIRDVYNLAWKIGAIIKQNLDHDLLDSYENERKPHARAYVETAIKVGHVINSVNNNLDIEGLPVEQSHERQIKSIAPQLGISSLAAPKAMSTSNKVGRPAKQFRIQPQNRFIDDIAGYQHIVVSDVKPIGLNHNVFWIDSLKHEEALSFLTELNAKAAWIRPDRYLGAATKSMEELYICVPYFIKAKQRWKDFDETGIN